MGAVRNRPMRSLFFSGCNEQTFFASEGAPSNEQALEVLLGAGVKGNSKSICSFSEVISLVLSNNPVGLSRKKPETNHLIFTVMKNAKL